MTRSRIQRIKLFVFLLIFLLAQGTVCGSSFRKREDIPHTILTNKNIEGTHKKDSAQGSGGHKAGQEHTVIHTVPTITSDANKTADGVTLQSPGDANKTTHVVKPQKEHFGEGHSTSLNPGALLRGLYVFVGLSVLVMAYIVFRSFRLSKTRAQMVRKYGVLTHRQDVEMRPLPLEEEDDEDTTVFDASNVLTNNVQHQNL